jgi:hypothetical protein
MSKSGVSLLEVVVALGLVAVIMPLILNLLPSSMMSLRRSERLAVATTLAAYRLDEAQLLPYKVGQDLDEVINLNPQRYRLQRVFTPVDDYRVDVSVSCVLLDSNLPPIELRTRLIREDQP